MEHTISFLGSVSACSKNDFLKLGITEAKINEAKASLLTEGFDAERNFDVLPVVFSLAVVNQFNENGDGMTTDVAIETLPYFKNKPINIEHKKNRIVGHIINASFSEKEPEFYENDIEDFRDKTSPFFITVAGLIYATIYPDLAVAISKASDPKDESYRSISSSWEIGFPSYSIKVGSGDDMNRGVLLELDDASEEQVDGLLCYGGSGYDEMGQTLRRVIKSPAYPLGAGLTLTPAAKVKGIYTKESFSALCEKDSNKGKANKNISQIKKEPVRKGKSTMNEEQFKAFLEQVQTSIASALKDKEEGKTIASQIVDALQEQGKNWKSAVEQEAEARKESEEALQTAQEQIKQLQGENDTVKEELDALKTSVAEKDRVALYEKRLQDIQDKYELDEKELNIVSAEVNNLGEKDEDFEGYVSDKLSVIFAHKDKEVLKKKAEANKAKKEAKASKEDDDKDDDLETSESKDKQVPNSNKDQTEEKSWLERLNGNFEVEVTV